tara:strand:- start:647 stop:895 length:249 start_codon:yes stop_codon:yes gene_type:complete
LALGLPADGRKYEIAARMLKEMNIPRVRLLTNNPEKVRGLESNGIEVVERIAHITGIGKDNINYLKTKGKKNGTHTVITTHF